MKKYKLLNTKTILFALGLTFLTACNDNSDIPTPTYETIIEESSESIDDTTIDDTTLEIENASETLLESIEESVEVEIPRSPIQIEEDKFEAIDNKYDYVYFKKDTEIYDDINGEVTNQIEVYNKAFEIFAVENWSLIEIDETLYYVENENIGFLGNTFAEVDIKDQNVKLFVDGEIVVDTDTVTGGKGHPTHTGLFEVWLKQHDRYLTGPGYKCWVSYFMAFDGGIGFHDATWRSEFGGEIYKKNGSHGCVNLPLEAAEVFNEYVEVGTKVLVHN